MHPPPAPHPCTRAPPATLHPTCTPATCTPPLPDLPTCTPSPAPPPADLPPRPPLPDLAPRPPLHPDCSRRLSHGAAFPDLHPCPCAPLACPTCTPCPCLALAWHGACSPLLVCTHCPHRPETPNRRTRAGTSRQTQKAAMFPAWRPFPFWRVPLHPTPCTAPLPLHPDCSRRLCAPPAPLPPHPLPNAFFSPGSQLPGPR